MNPVLEHAIALLEASRAELEAVLLELRLTDLETEIAALRKQRRDSADPDSDG